MGNMVTKSTLRKDWLASRRDSGLLAPPSESWWGAEHRRHTQALPASGPLASLNDEFGDQGPQVWVGIYPDLTPVAGSDRCHVRFVVYLHKEENAHIGTDHPLVAAVGRTLGVAIDPTGWRQWKAVVSESRKNLNRTDAFVFLDESVAALAGRAGGASTDHRPTAATVAPIAATDRTTAASTVKAEALSTVANRVFIASKINGYPKAKQVRHSIRRRLTDFSFDAYVAESDLVYGFQQSHIDRMIETSQDVVVIVWDSIGKATLAEAELALRTGRGGTAPRVHVFLSTDEAHIAARDEPTRTFLNRLDEQRMYSHLFRGDKDLIDKVVDVFVDLDLAN